MAADLLAAWPVLARSRLRHMAEQAVVATVTPADAALLRSLVAAAEPSVRALALAGYAAALGRRALPELRAWLEHESPHVRLAAAWAVADLGDRACLPVFAELLDADELELRLDAVKALRRISGQRFGYVAMADTSERTVAVLAWGDWVGGYRETATWRTPVPRAAPHVGRLLVTLYNRQRVLEFDLEGKQLWEQRVLAGWACCGTPQGHRLVAQITSRQVVEYDARGRQVRVFRALPGFPNSVQRLPNGNTLVAISFGVDTLIEFDPEGRRVWERKLDGYPTDAERLPNGNTLVALYKANKVVEVDAAGRTVWEIRDLKSPYAAQRLENGNTLVAENTANRVVELTPTGEVVWEHETPGGCSAARRLPDGRTLISSGAGVRLVDWTGETTWILRARGALRANCY